MKKLFHAKFKDVLSLGILEVALPCSSKGLFNTHLCKIAIQEESKP